MVCWISARLDLKQMQVIAYDPGRECKQARLLDNLEEGVVLLKDRRRVEIAGGVPGAGCPSPLGQARATFSLPRHDALLPVRACRWLRARERLSGALQKRAAYQPRAQQKAIASEGVGVGV